MENGKTLSIMIIEDNTMYATALNEFLYINLINSFEVVSISTYHTSEGCTEALNKNKLKPDIIIIDYFLNSHFFEAMNGLDALFHLKIYNSEMEIIFLSSQNKIEVAVDAIKSGAFDYIVKDADAFKNVLKSIHKCISVLKAQGIKFSAKSNEQVSL